MAQMQSRAENIENRLERRVFQLLERQLDDDWIVWHEPKLTREGRLNYRPDFILLHPRRGLFVLEVKGWRWEKILGVLHADVVKEASPSKNLLVKETRVNYAYSQPDASARGVQPPFDQLNKYKRWLRKELEERLKGHVAGKHQYRLWGGRVYFANISFRYRQTSDLLESRLEQVRARLVLDEKRGYYREHGRQWARDAWRLAQDLSADASASLSLDAATLAHLRSAIHPESQIRPLGLVRLGDTDTGWFPDLIEILEDDLAVASPVLDLEQEKVARNFIGGGHRILFGVAGSGKTVIAIARARYQAMRDPQQRILFLCFNRALCEYIRRALSDVTPTVAVKTFHAWAGHEFRYQQFGKEEDATYDKELCAHLARNGARRQYDCILIDESQDWRTGWFRAVLHAAKDPENGDLLIAGDGSQSIFRQNRNFSWKACGIKAQGRVINRRGGRVNTFRNYRNSPEIVALAVHFASRHVADSSARSGVRTLEDSMMSLLPVPEECHKDPSRFLPVVCGFQTDRQELEFVVTAVANLVEFGRIQPQDIAILYPRASGNQKNLLRRATSTLDAQGVGVEWITSQERNHHRVLQDKVTISTVALMKGLEFKVCFLIWVNSYAPNDEETLLYVGMTRATERLHISGHWWSRPNQLVAKLLADPNLYLEHEMHGAWTNGLVSPDALLSLDQDDEFNPDIPF